MIWNNRWIKTICLILGVFILVINIVIYFNDTPTVGHGGGWWTWLNIGDFKWWNYDYYNEKFSAQHYFGFRYFFNKLSTFPGLQFVTDATTKYANIVTNFNVTNIPAIDVLFAIFRVVSTPVVLLFAFLTDVINNLVWFVSFIKDGIENPTSDVVNLHDSNYIGTFSNVPLYLFPFEGLRELC